jgi:hypothetical protein
MNFKSHALSLAKIIEETKPLWSCEVMNEFPQSIEDYQTKWLEELGQCTDDELFDFDCKRNVDKLSQSTLEEFLKPVRELCQLEEFSPDPVSLPLAPLENWAYQGVKKKKRHEIDRMAPAIKSTFQHLQCKRVVDIGGGVGHLARILAHYYQMPTTSIDQNLDFQNIGKHRLQKFRKLPGASEVTFINATLDLEDKTQILAQEINHEAFLLGLHTCGALANTLIRSAEKFKSSALFNFGCCYYRMNPETDLWQSDFYKNGLFPKLNLYGLTLATRSHAEDDRSTFDTKIRVKMYRNALHLFLLEKYNNKHETDVGECPIQVYWQPFSQYVSMKLKELNIEHQFSQLDFEEFYSRSDIQQTLRKMVLCNLIRWQLGRALEIYILLDRALFLEEHQYQVSVKTYFKESLSPRNIGILAIKK